MGIAALVLGIFAIILCVIPSFAVTQGFGGLVALVALVLGIAGRRQAAETDQTTGLATAGMVLGIVAFVLNAAVFASCMVCQARFGDEFRKGLRKGLEKARREMDKARDMEKARRQMKEKGALPDPPPFEVPPASGEPPATAEPPATGESPATGQPQDPAESPAP